MESVTRMIFELPGRPGTEGNTWMFDLNNTLGSHVWSFKGNQELGQAQGILLFLWSCISKQL